MGSEDEINYQVGTCVFGGEISAKEIYSKELLFLLKFADDNKDYKFCRCFTNRDS
jgi:hypothetical protein